MYWCSTTNSSTLSSCLWKSKEWCCGFKCSAQINNIIPFWINVHHPNKHHISISQLTSLAYRIAYNLIRYQCSWYVTIAEITYTNRYRKSDFTGVCTWKIYVWIANVWKAIKHVLYNANKVFISIGSIARWEEHIYPKSKVCTNTDYHTYQYSSARDEHRIGLILSSFRIQKKNKIFFTIFYLRWKWQRQMKWTQEKLT